MGRLAHQTELIHDKLKRKSPSRRTGGRSSENIVIVRGALERRDPDFADKMAQVLCVYRQVKLLKKTAALSKRNSSDRVAVAPYHGKARDQAVAPIPPHLSPRPRVDATFSPGHEHNPAGAVRWPA